MPRLTVITITCDDADGLRATKESLSHGNFNWIVVDGTKNPKTKSQNRTILRDVVCTHIQESDEGRFDAMNKGLSLVQTDLVTFLNSGDCHANKKVVANICKSYRKQNWNWAVGETIAVNSHGKKLWLWPMPHYNSLRFKLGVRSFSHQATVYKTSFLMSFGGFRRDSLYSDWIVSLKMAKHSKPAIISQIWCHFLEGGVSAQQTVAYWRKESVRLRKLENVVISRIYSIDLILQNLCAFLIKLDRGKLLMRPDLGQKYKISLNDGQNLRTKSQ